MAIFGRKNRIFYLIQQILRRKNAINGNFSSQNGGYVNTNAWNKNRAAARKIKQNKFLL